MTQSRRLSAIETITNVVVGFGISWLLSFYILPIWGFVQSAQAATSVTIIYTIASVARSYTLRRIFNAL